MKRAFVFGGTGAVGSAILRELARRSVHATFTYHRSEDKAKMLAAELGHVAVRVDLADGGATTTLLDAQPVADVVIHAAGRLRRGQTLAFRSDGLVRVDDAVAPLPGALDLAREYLELHMLGGIVCAAIGRA